MLHTSVKTRRGDFLMGITFSKTPELPFINSNPASSIAEFEQILLSNSGEDAFESAIKLLAAKLVDELEHKNGATQRFKIHGSSETTHLEITELYKLAIQRWPQLNGNGAELNITPPHLVRSMRTLLGWQLYGSDLSYLDATLERLVARDSKGALGQYFTPREIIRLCVDVLNPGPNDIVMDPACGSGGFLFEAVNHSMKISKKSPKCLGLDFSVKSVKVATLLAAAAGDNTITISNANSLDGRSYIDNAPKEWQDFLCNDKASNTKRAINWGAWNKLGCDVLLTNPPFAGDIDEYDLLDAYESQQDQSSRKSVSREHLFIERAVNLLRPGGRIAIVVPQGVLANSTASYLRTWLFRKCRIIAVVGLHQYAFLPYTGVKTALLFISKPGDGEVLPSDYPVLFTVSNSPGKDSSGRDAGCCDYSAIGNALKKFIISQRYKWAADEGIKLEDSHIAVEEVMLSEICQSGRLDAEHYDPTARELEKKLFNISNSRISDVTEQRVPRFKRNSFKDITYVDISSVDKRTGLTFPDIIPANEAPSRASYLVEPSDILVSTVRPDRNVIAMVTGDHEAPQIASNGFCVLRANTVQSEYLFAYCKTDAFKKILTMHSTASMYPTVNDKDVLSVPFLHPTEEIENEVTEKIRSGLQMIDQAQRQISEAIKIVEDYIEQTSGLSN